MTRGRGMPILGGSPPSPRWAAAAVRGRRPQRVVQALAPDRAPGPARAQPGPQSCEQPRLDDVRGPLVERVRRGRRRDEAESHERLCDGAPDRDPHGLPRPACERPVSLIHEGRRAHRLVVRDPEAAAGHRRVDLNARRVAVANSRCPSQPVCRTPWCAPVRPPGHPPSAQEAHVRRSPPSCWRRRCPTCRAPAAVRRRG
eukprot:3047930-Prymnesium_polylepis.1